MPQLSTEDRLAIGEVIARYCHCVDRGRWEEFVELFSEDCRLDLSQVLGLYEGKAGIRKFVETMQALPIVMRHLVTNVVIRGDGDRARSECYVLALTGGEGQTNQTPGFYDDEFVKQNGRWLLRARRLTLDVAKA
jgi:3-phenylpropionate/cinnamic acid dioxygenase small subunit